MADGAHTPREAETANRVAEAEKAHQRGWQITPLRGKRPYLTAWTKQPAPKLVDLQAWAHADNVGIRTGRVSGIVVIDDDTEDTSAESTLNLPLTPTVLTGGGGMHFYFRAPTEAIGNSASKLAPNVDVKGEGGMVVAVGSIHPDSGRMYVWAPGRSPDEVALAELPESVVRRLTKRGVKADRFAPGTAEHERIRRHARSAFQRHVEILGTVPEGTRNDALNRAAFGLGRFIGAGFLDHAEVERALHAAAITAGLGESETRATIWSGIEAGVADPHDLAGLSRKASRSANEGGDIPARPQPDERERPVILVEGGRLPEVVSAAEQALLRDGGPQIYQRENLLVRMVRSANVQEADGIRRQRGALTLTMIEPAYLVERFTRAASFQKLDARSGSYKVIDCPERVATTYLARKGDWKALVIRAVVEAPTLRRDGTILQVPGYDAATELFFDPGSTEFAKVPEEPGRDDAMAALAQLHEIVQGFPFVAGCDRAVALAAMLTGLLRRSLRTAPLFAFRAPKMGSGKSLLCDVVAMIATGRPVPAMPQGHDEDEDRKRLLAILIEGEPVCCIDNVERPLSSAALCSILTQVTWRDRILGRTGTATVPTCTTFLASGNNLVLVGDLTTRALVCDLDAKVEHPEAREFAVNLYEYVPERRGQLAAAGLTILRAYHVAGRPKQGLPSFGRFESWSNWVRSALVWCGEADPCETRARIEAVDPVRQQMRAVLMNWDVVLGKRAVTAAEVILAASADRSARAVAFRQTLVDALGGAESDLHTLRLGHWLAKHERRPEGGYRVERVGERQGMVLWRVVHG